MASHLPFWGGRREGGNSGSWSRRHERCEGRVSDLRILELQVINIW